MKRLRNIAKKTSIIAISIAIILINMCLPVCATNKENENEEKETGLVFINTEYSEYIIPEETDIFEITVRDRDTQLETSFKINTYEAKEKQIKVKLGDVSKNLEVVRMEYLGNNPAIIQYGMTERFPIGGVKPKIIIDIKIGAEAVDQYDYFYSDVYKYYYISDRAIKEEDGSVSTYYTRYEELLETEKKNQELRSKENSGLTEIIESQDKLDEYEDDSIFNEDYGIEIQPPADEEPVIEVYNLNEQNEDNANEKDENYATKSIILLCVVFIMVITIVIVVKKGGFTKTKR